MSNIEKIRQKIERLYDGEVPKHDQQCDFGDGYFTGLATILNIIDTLLEEKPSEDLEKEVKRYYSDNFTYISSDQPTLSILTNVARHFAEWQRKQDEHLIWRIAEKNSEGGKEAMKEQMMKDAVEGEIVKDITNKLAVTAKNINLDGFKFGDKVKIIIVKNEE